MAVCNLFEVMMTLKGPPKNKQMNYRGMGVKLKNIGHPNINTGTTLH